jgi:hypothetical protein
MFNLDFKTNLKYLINCADEGDLVKMINKNILFFKRQKDTYVNHQVNEFRKYFHKVYSLVYPTLFKRLGKINFELILINYIIRKKIDIIIINMFGKNFELEPEFLCDIKKLGVKVVFMSLDSETELDHEKYFSQLADFIIIADYFNKYYYESLGIPSFLYFSSYSSKEYFPYNLDDRNIDVSFVGWMDKADRKEYIDYLLKHNINVEIFGVGTTGGEVSLKKMIDIFNRSKINLNFTKAGFSGDVIENNWLNIRKRQNKGRPIEISLTNSFCLSEYAPSIKYVFEEGKEIVTFYSKEDLLSKIHFFLQNKKERERIAANAYKKALKYYESDVYIKDVVENMMSQLEYETDCRSQDIFIDDNFRVRNCCFFIAQSHQSLRKKQYKKSKEFLLLSLKFGILIFFRGFLLCLRKKYKYKTYITGK